MRSGLSRYVSVLLILLLCCSCGRKPPWSFEPQREGTRGFRLTTPHFSCEGMVEITGCGLCSLSFTVPESLSAVTMTQEQNELTVHVADHEDTMDLAELPDNAVIKVLLQALQVFLYHKLAFEKGAADTFTAAAEVLGFPMTAVYGEDGALQSLRCDLLELTAAFG